MCDIRPFIELLDKARRVVVLTGAGVSTLSGIPDFRSSTGLYSKEFGSMSVEEILDIEFFKAHPDVFYDWAREYWFQMDRYSPNIIHETLAEMERKGKLSEGIFTQNIDSLHQKAGSRRVYELHGSLRSGYCIGCHRYYDYAYLADAVNRRIVPVCQTCGSLVKPDIVFYGESLDTTMLMRGENAFTNADLAIILGSSLVVNPAAALPYRSVMAGRDIVIVNRQPTYLDSYASLRYDDLESFFAALQPELSRYPG